MNHLFSPPLAGRLLAALAAVVALAVAAPWVVLTVRQQAQPAEPGPQLETLGEQVAGPTTTPLDLPRGSIGGVVTYDDGMPAAGVVVDLYRALPNGARQEYLATTTSAEDGSYRFQAEPGCHVLVFAGPTPDPETTITRSMGCEEGSSAYRLDAVVPDPEGQALRSGRFGAAAGIGPASPEGPSHPPAGPEISQPPSGQPWASPSIPQSAEGRAAASGAEPVTPANPATAPQADEPQGATEPAGPDTAEIEAALSAVELELVRLTNELRLDPSGPLRRRGPRPACIDEPYYAIVVDEADGHPAPVPALQVDLTVSAEVARAWASRMYRSGSFSHRPSSAQQQIYTQLGIEALAWGENIAWAAGYEPEEVAQIHFEGWRESDAGHYCSLVTRRFTRIGIGEIRVEGESWAVQNFFHPETAPILVASD